MSNRLDTGSNAKMSQSSVFASIGRLSVDDMIKPPAVDIATAMRLLAERQELAADRLMRMVELVGSAKAAFCQTRDDGPSKSIVSPGECVHARMALIEMCVDALECELSAFASS